MYKETNAKPGLNLGNSIGIFVILLFSLSTRAAPSFIAHLPNFSAIDATALFCGAYFAQRRNACLALLLLVWASDIFLNKFMLGHWSLFYPGFYWQYAAYTLITLVGHTLKTHTADCKRLLAASGLSAVLFFMLSNFGVWAEGILYPHTLRGAIACYVAAIPFFKNTLLSDILFTFVLFGMDAFMKKFRLVAYSARSVEITSA
jgi:hypothetical protein